MNCLVFFSIFWIAKSIDLSCPLSVCPDIKKGDHKCNPECMTSYCNYDTSPLIDSSLLKENSDCYHNCININSCDPKNLGNGLCDSSCNTQNCGFDWGDCNCSLGCLDSMLGDGKCDEYCNNWNCDLDNHDCGHCANGCFPNMLGNGICDSECNNEDCLYDYNDCQCADNCLWTDYGLCKPECLVNSCNFDKVDQYPNNWCTNNSLAIFSSYQQIIRNNFSYVANLEDCYAASNYTCSLEKALNFSDCYEECNILECNYANGNCYTNDYLDPFCQRSYQEADGCISCRSNALHGVLSNKNCEWGVEYWTNLTLFPDESFVAIPIIDTTSSKKIPHVYFIAPNEDPQSPLGNGTYFYPYESISYCLSRIKHNYSIIYLLKGEIHYTVSMYLLDVHLFLPSYAVPYIAFENFAGKSIKITPLDSSPITIKRSKHTQIDLDISDPTFLFYIKNAKNFEISNIIFDWNFTLPTCASGEYCEYCPYVVYDSVLNAYYNDKGEILDAFLPSYWCLKEQNYDFFTLVSSNLVLTNVTFINFRSGFRSILCTIGASNSTLNNVTFDNIKNYDGDNSGVIIDRCNQLLAENIDNIYGNLKFENCIISRINNGYEIDDRVNLKGFLNLEAISTIVLSNIKFQNNVVFKKLETGINEASLFTLGLFQWLLIDSCTFEYNYCDSGLFYIQQTHNSFNIEINDKEEIIYSTISNIHIYNSNFTSNYGKTAGILYASYEGKSQNFVIENSEFILNGIEAGALIHIASSYADQKYEKDSIINVATSDGNFVQGKYLAKWGKIHNTKFNENYSGGSGIIEIAGMINIEFANIEINYNGANLSNIININSLLLKYYIENPNMYITLNSADYPDLNCDFLASVSDSINFNIEAAYIKENYCKSSSPSILISNTLNITIKSAYFEENSGLGSYGNCLDLNGNDLVTITDSQFISNTNYESKGTVAISSLSNLLLINCSFYNNTGYLGGALYFAAQNLHIDSSNFDSNKSPNLSGGAIYFSISSLNNKNLQFYVSKSTFKKNFAGINGGGIFITRDSILECILSIIILDSIFYNNQALEGSCIYIDDNTFISADSSIDNCEFQENNAIFSGTISIYYIYGSLFINRCTFANNYGAYSSGFNIAIGESSEIFTSKIILNSCIFQYNSGTVLVSFDNPNLNSSIEINNCLFEYNAGSIFSLDNGYISDKNSIYSHNYSPISGAVLNLKNSAVFLSENSIYHNCSSDLNGGVASISLKSQFSCFSCIFTQNTAGNSGGVIYANSDAKFHISNSVINKNICKNRGSAIYMASCLVSSSLDNTKISENYAYSEGTITLLSSEISIVFLKMSSNTAGGKNPGIFLEESNAIIESSAFFDQNGDQGCFILLSMSSMKTINSSFANGYSNSSGVAIHATSSTLNIYSTIFSNLFSADNGGIISLYELSIMQIESSIFLNSNMAIDASSSSLFISNSTFRNNSNNAISGTQILNLSISNSEFSDGSAVNGGALFCSQCGDISISSSNFINNFADKGGAIYISNEDSSNKTNCNITSSSFISNAAAYGGAIWANTIDLFISSSNFSENRAKFLHNETIQEMLDGIGGAIKISCKISDYLCNFDISSNNFSQNSATYNGGAINWDDSKPEFKNNIFWNNSAQYGNDIASFPVMVIFINESNNRIFNDNWESTTLTLSNIASGQKNNPPLTFALVDDLYQIVTTDISSQALLKSFSNNSVLSGTLTAYAVNGIYYFDDYVISAKPGTEIQIYVESAAIDESKRNIVQMVEIPSQFVINAKIRLCEIGEATIGIECESCLENYYNINLNDSKCLACPSSAICYGNYTMVPKSGYWRSNKFTDKFWKCPFPTACLGPPDSKTISFTGNCKKGYGDNLCHSCEKGYSRLYKNECQKCPNAVSNGFRLIGIFVLLVFIAIVIIKSSRKAAFKPTCFLSIYMKIFWNYLQIIMIIATFNLNWPHKAAQFFHIQIFIDYINTQLFSVDCFLQSSYSKEKIFYYKILIASFTPFFFAFICLISWILIYAVKRRNLWKIKDDYISSFTVLLFLIHPSIINTMFGLFSCKEINSGEYWLNSDLGIRCWNYNHLFYTFLFALPTICIWAIAIPVLCLIKLVKNKHKLDDISTRLRFGFLFNGYKSKYYYWEFLILYHKIILITCSVFFSDISTNIQVLTAMLQLIFSLHIQAKNQPYCETLLNKADIFSRLVSLITVLIILLFLTDDLDTVGKNILVVLLWLSNLLFFIYIAIKIFSQFYLFKATISLFKRIFYFWKGRKYEVGADDEDSNKIDKDYESITLSNKKLVSTTIFSEESKIINLPEFERNDNISLEIDPLPSEPSE